MAPSARPPAGFGRSDDIPRLPPRIGSYTIERQIGSGGMAVVYAARQDVPRRTVALKVMRPGVAAGASARRFRREMEVLARLRHPFIAQIYDAGMWDDGGGGMPYFVMEYIPQATPIDEACSGRGLDVRERLKLFLKVCAGVQHGHAQGIVHRDLKPGNILVTQGGEPKIIDYGVASVSESDLAGPTQATEAGKLVGTVAYMSPEQVDARPGEIDPRTDVYSLGVVLYRLLADRSPYPLGGIALHEAVRVIREDAPTRPSLIKPELRGDLETIILTCLEKDRTRRYADAGALGRDLLRFLARKPIRARPAGPFYRLNLFVRRNRTAVVAGTMVGLAVAVLAVGAFWYRRNAEELRQARETIVQADSARQRSESEARERAAVLLAGSSAAGAVSPTEIVLAEHRRPVLALASDGAGSRLASLDAEGVLLVWDLAAQRVIQRSPPLDALSGAMALVPAGDRVLLGRADGLVESMRVDNGTFADTPLVHGGKVTALACSGDGRLVASAGADLVVRLWPTAERESRPLRRVEGLASALALDAGATTLAAGMAAGDLLLVRALRTRAVAEGPAPTVTRMGETGVTHVALSRDGLIVAAGTADGRLRVAQRGTVDTAAGTDTRDGPDEQSVLWTARGHERPLTAMALSPDGQRLASADDSGLVRIWSLSGAQLREFRHGTKDAGGTVAAAPVWALAFTGDGRWLAIGGDDARVVLVAIE